MAILKVNNLKKIYVTRFGSNQVQALSNINFAVEAGEYVAIMGESGSGKTTLLNILAALDRPTSGEVLLEGRNITNIKFLLSAGIILGLYSRTLTFLTTFHLKIIYSCHLYYKEKHQELWNRNLNL